MSSRYWMSCGFVVEMIRASRHRRAQTESRDILNEVAVDIADRAHA